MSLTTITSANSVFTITVPGLFPSPVKLEGYSADKAFSTEPVSFAEVSMGVDGRMTAGYTPTPTKQTITLQADSPSRAIFTAIIAAIKSGREIFYINGSLSIPSTGEAFTMTRGVLTNVHQLPDAAKVLQPVEYEVTWQDISPAPL